MAGRPAAALERRCRAMSDHEYLTPEQLRRLEVMIAQSLRQAEKERAPNPFARVAELLLLEASESEREPGAACDVSASPPEGAQAENAWTARAFASSLGVAGAVAEALLDGAAVPAGGEFEFMQSLAGRPDDIEAKLRKGRLVERVAKMLSKGAEEKLKTAEAKTGAELNDKFATDAFKGEMGFGGTAEYYRGARPTRT